MEMATEAGAGMEAGTGMEMEMAVGAATAVAAGAVDPRREWLCFPGV
jgi:hypothetical protein